MKKIIRTIFIFLILNCFQQNFFAQNINTDSIEVFLKNEKNDTVKMNTLNKFCRNFWQTGEYDKALNYAQTALSIAKKLKLKKGITSAYNNLGVTYWYQGHYAKALENHLAALKIKEELVEQAEKSKDPVQLKESKNSVAKSFNNIGIVYDAQRNFPKALEYYELALKMQEELGDRNGVASDLNNIGNVYHSEKNYSKAVAYFLRCLKMMQEMENKMGIESSLANLGNVYKSQRNYSKALEYDMQCLAMAEELNDRNGITVSLNNLGLVYAELGQYEKALEFLNKGLISAKEIDSKEWMKISYEGLSDLYEKMKQPAKALAYYKLFSDVKDSLLNDDNNKHIAQMQAQFDSNKKDSEINLLNKDKVLKETEIQKQKAETEKQQTQRNAFIVGFALVILLALFIFRSYRQKQKANIIITHQKVEVEKQKHIIEEKNKDITDSINYARRIQTAMLAPIEDISKTLKEFFILYKPKDIVSGDFYYYAVAGDKIIIAVADCTGHGVPGAFMSMIGNDALNEIILEKKCIVPGEILSNLHDGVRKALKQDTSKTQTADGMDIALCALDLKNNILEYAGALRNLYISRGQNKLLEEIKANKQSIGGVKSDVKKIFTNNTIQLNKGDAFYIFSDGYADQFGGTEGKKFMIKRLKDTLLEIQNNTMPEQETILNNTIEEWKGSTEQVDDILVVGVRV